MQDKFNLTSWVRNKTLLKEEEEKPDVTDQIGAIYKYVNGAMSQTVKVVDYQKRPNNYDLISYQKVDDEGNPEGEVRKMDANKFHSMFDTYVKGGKTVNEEVDGFEDSENLPEEVKELLDMWSDRLSHGQGGYDAVGEMLDDFEELGWTFDFGLDGEPYGLRPMNDGGTSMYNDDSEDPFPSIPKGDMNEDQSDWERFYEEGYLAGYAACQRGVPNRFAGGDEDMPASDYSARRKSEKY